MLSGALVVAIGAGGGAVLWSLVQVPDFYEEALAQQPDPAVRQEIAETFVERTVQLLDDIEHSDAWSQEFTDREVNAWLAEQLHQKFAEMVPKGVRDPRVRFDNQRVLLGFAYEHENWDGVVSLRLRPWVPEPNQLAIEIESIRAGLFPIPLESVLDELEQQMESDDWRAEWTHVNGNDVLLVRFAGGQPDQPVLEEVQVTAGGVRISGSRSVDRTESEGRAGLDTRSALNVSITDDQPAGE